jgi:SAM-dependent methyltransferase
MQPLNDIRQQFDAYPYPGGVAPVKYSPRQMYFHSVQSASWRVWRKDPAQNNLVILDAGCGTGRTTVLLAKANPEAQILGVDISETSISIARALAQREGCGNIQFECRSLEEPDPQGRTFDYINADEVLYLVPDLPAVLSTLSAQLKPRGILRANFHCIYQRSSWLRFQKFFDHLGLMNGEASEANIATAREVMAALNPALPLAAKHQRAVRMSAQGIMSNLLLRGDKGFAFPELFDLLASAGMRIASMLEWPVWEPETLFAPNMQMDSLIAERLERMSVEQSLEMVQLLSGQKRLLDFWAVSRLADAPTDPMPVDLNEYSQISITPHPCATKNQRLKRILEESVKQFRCVELNRLWPVPQLRQLIIDPVKASVVLHIFHGGQTIGSLIDHFEAATHLLQSSPYQRKQCIMDFLLSLESMGMVLLERS